MACKLLNMDALKNELAGTYSIKILRLAVKCKLQIGQQHCEGLTARWLVIAMVLPELLSYPRCARATTLPFNTKLNSCDCQNNLGF